MNIKTFNFNKNMCKYMLLQRSELLTNRQKKIRKLFGRYLFTNFFINFITNIKIVGEKYFLCIEEDFISIRKFLPNNVKNILCIGSGLGGLEVFLYEAFSNPVLFLVEKNYLSKKVVYGWDEENNEAYNNLDLTENFLTLNNIPKSSFKIFDYETENLPSVKYDLIISLWSLDYHYNFDTYYEYLKKTSKESTLFIFDTIRADYFNKIFKRVEIIYKNDSKIHKSSRIACNGIIN